MTPSKVLVDTTVLTDALLKRNQQGEVAVRALNSCQETILPVYAIKEFKAGPLDYFVYLHNKLHATRSLAATTRAVAQLVGFQKNRAKTAIEALADLQMQGVQRKMSDHELAELYRVSLARLILSAWGKRRKITTSVSGELPCYTEQGPKIEVRTGYMSNSGKLCKLYGNDECCLSRGLKERKDDLKRLIEAMERRNGREHTRRRAVLHKLANTPKKPMSSRDCVHLGDAFFALNAPPGAAILTTNTKDHSPLADALGKSAVRPEECARVDTSK